MSISDSAGPESNDCGYLEMALEEQYREDMRQRKLDKEFREKVYKLVQEYHDKFYGERV